MHYAIPSYEIATFLPRAQFGFGEEYRAFEGDDLHRRVAMPLVAPGTHERTPQIGDGPANSFSIFLASLSWHRSSAAYPTTPRNFAGSMDAFLHRVLRVPVTVVQLVLVSHARMQGAKWGCLVDKPTVSEYAAQQANRSYKYTGSASKQLRSTKANNSNTSTGSEKHKASLSKSFAKHRELLMKHR